MLFIFVVAVLIRGLLSAATSFLLLQGVVKRLVEALKIINVELKLQIALRNLNLDASGKRNAIDGVIFVAAVARGSDQLAALIIDVSPETA